MNLPNHCKICKDSEHDDYGDRSYTTIKHSEYNRKIIVCSDHFDSEYNNILKEYQTVNK